MKWFKHENTFSNPKIEVLKEKFGTLGYGFYFQIVELIATNIEKDNRLDWGYLPEEYDSQYLTKKLKIDLKNYEAILNECIRLKLLNKKDNRIFCGKVLERCDDYTSQLLRETRRNFEETSSRKEKNRKEEKKTE